MSADGRKHVAPSAVVYMVCCLDHTGAKCKHFSVSLQGNSHLKLLTAKLVLVALASLMAGCKDMYKKQRLSQPDHSCSRLARSCSLAITTSHSLLHTTSDNHTQTSQPFAHADMPACILGRERGEGEQRPPFVTEGQCSCTCMLHNPLIQEQATPLACSIKMPSITEVTEAEGSRVRTPPRTSQREEAAHVHGAALPGGPQHSLQLQRHGPVEVRSWIGRQQAKPRALQLLERCAPARLQHKACKDVHALTPRHGCGKVTACKMCYHMEPLDRVFDERVACNRHGSSLKQRCCSWPELTLCFAEALACMAACAWMRGVRQPCLFWQPHAARRTYSTLLV